LASRDDNANQVERGALRTENAAGVVSRRPCCVTPSRLLRDTDGQSAAVIDSAGRLFRVVPEHQLLAIDLRCEGI
jgi:hypothetical protein